MAQRDYIRKKQSKKNNSRVIPTVMMAIAIILVMLFVAILYFVSTNKTNNKPQTANPTVTEKPQVSLPDKPQERWTYLKQLENPDGNSNYTTSPNAVTPTQTMAHQQERQAILDSFAQGQPNPQTAATSAANTVKPTLPTDIKTPQQPTNAQTTQHVTGKWLIQCGAFKTEANAKSLKAKLAMVGVTSTVRFEKLHRVLAGPYSNKSEAEQILTNLKNSGISGCIITQ